MKNLKKYLPYILAGAALVGLYLQYRQYQIARGDCDCEENSPVGPIN